MGWERGMGRRVLMEAENGDMAPSSDQTGNGIPPLTPPSLPSCCQHLSASPKTSCDRQGLGINSSLFMPPSRMMLRSSAESILVCSRDTKPMENMSFVAFCLPCPAGKEGWLQPSHPGLDRVWTLLEDCSEPHIHSFGTGCPGS